MKQNKLNIICSWLFLLCFIAGQYTVTIHQHNILKQNQRTAGIAKHNQDPTTTLQEKCYLCDAMHHTNMVLNNPSYYHPIVITNHVFRVGDYNFKSIALILAAGRGPPVFYSAC
ncbi:hypothetical protein [Mucilaginibacter puniceus]